jgi:hypothetical protein
MIHSCVGLTYVSDKMKLGTFMEILDAINHVNFYLHQMNILRAGVGSKRVYSLECK